ncbi:MAG: amino acid ABC transporter permease [Oscillospiraceae bacterium]
MKISRLFVSKPNKKTSPLIAAANLILVCAFIVAVFWLSLRAVGVAFNFSFVADFRQRLWDGFLMTLALSLVSLVLSLFIGALAALGQLSRVLALKYLCNIYVNFIRGTPLIMQIYLFFYIIGTAWGVSNRFVAGAIVLSVFEGAYIAEIIRGSLLSIEKSQLEAAKAVGFSRRQTVKNVILPQLVARTLPALTGQFASIIKDSSLLSIIAVIELTQTIREITATNFQFFSCYIFLGVAYLCLTLPLSFFSHRLERRFNYEN